MKKKKITRKFLLAVIFASLVNVLALVIWLMFKVSPLIPLIENIRDEITTNEIKNIYEKYDEFMLDINRISHKYQVTFVIEDVNGEIVNDVILDTDLILVTDMVKVEGEAYLLKVYSNKGIGIYKIVSQLVMFQIIILLIVLSVFFGYTRSNIIKPIYELVDEIRNYKFGNKPKRKVVQNELDLITNEFVSLTEKLDLEKEEQNRIIASISHDIKTPLTSIIGYSELIKEYELPNDIDKYVGKITDKADRIKEILSAFDDYLFNHEKLSLNLDNIKVKEIVSDLYNDYLVELNSKNIKFEVKTKLKREYVKVDVLKLKRILSNIIANSVRFLDQDGKVVVEILRDNNNYLFRVTDNGPGVKEEVLEKIFSPLFTTDKSRKVSGLGLSICKTFVEMHGGNIKAFNKEGFVVEFTIPISKDKL